MSSRGLVQVTVGGTSFSVRPHYSGFKVIGRGSYGVVISATDERRKKKVAIKRIKPMAGHAADAKPASAWKRGPWRPRLRALRPQLRARRPRCRAARSFVQRLAGCNARRGQWKPPLRQCCHKKQPGLLASRCVQRLCYTVTYSQ